VTNRSRSLVALKTALRTTFSQKLPDRPAEQSGSVEVWAACAGSARIESENSYDGGSSLRDQT
jgi:hypothetical protein